MSWIPWGFVNIRGFYNKKIARSSQYRLKATPICAALLRCVPRKEFNANVWTLRRLFYFFALWVRTLSFLQSVGGMNQVLRIIIRAGLTWDKIYDTRIYLERNPKEIPFNFCVNYSWLTLLIVLVCFTITLTSSANGNFSRMEPCKQSLGWCSRNTSENFRCSQLFAWVLNLQKTSSEKHTSFF